MAALDRAALKLLFQQGDAPSETDYGSLIDSALILAETTSQTVQGAVVFAGGVAFAAVSAATVGGASATFSTLSAATITVSTLRVSGATVGRSFGEIFVQTTAASVIGVVGTFVQVSASTSAESTFNNDFVNNGTGRLTYSGTATKKFLAEFKFSVAPTSASQTIAVRLAKNGTTLGKSDIEVRCVTNSAAVPGSTQALVSLTTNDFIEYYVTNRSNVSNATFEKAILTLTEIG